jgi:hypothetical protein
MAVRALACAALALALAAPAGGKTLLILDSDPGDYVGQGMLRTFLPADGTFTAQKNFDEGVSVSFDGSESWDADFAAPGSVPLDLLLYTGAERFPFQSPALPGLSVTGDGRGCNELEGDFQVHEIVYGTGTDITSFAADFVQYCEGGPRRLVGAVRFNASDALPDIVDTDGDGEADIGDNCQALANPDQHDADLDREGDLCDASPEASFVVLASEAGDYIGQGQRIHLNAANALFTLEINFDGGVSVSADDGDSWSLDFTAAGGGAPVPGVYEGATRWPFNGPAEPGLSVSGAGRGCNALTGRFEVFELAVDAGGKVQAFSADFEQHCEGGEPALFGSVRWRAPFRPAPKDLDGDGWLDKQDNCPGVGNPPQWDADGDGRGDGCGLPPAAQKCVNDLNKGGAALAKLQGGASRACLKAAAQGVAGAQACLGADAAGKMAASMAKLTAKEAKSCAVDPDFGRTGAAAIYGAAAAEGIALVADLFGADLDAAAIAAAADPVGAKCQDELAKRSAAALDGLWKLALKQKKAVLLGAKTLMATDADALGAMLTAHLESDPKGGVSRLFAALDAGAAKRCAGVDLAAAFPGCAPADLPALGACAERAVRCRFCRQLNAFDALAADCDTFDDADGANTTCQ